MPTTRLSSISMGFPKPARYQPSFSPVVQYFLLLVGIVCCSISVIFIKKSGVDPILLSGMRLAIAAVVLAPLYAIDWRRYRSQLTLRHLQDTALPGLVLALHFISWIIGARLTPAANSTLIVNIVPVVMPALLWLLVRERLTKREILATLIVTL
ncbi:MAG: DMT family transporter, partial [Planctomycetota bacterium]